ncbi:ABC transporter ATP-binding protein [Acuticoccus sp. I52.16.1]|uniref:ABC transporter ATP-binding protein n=1 Tax=Acuticoccus sp. I52.16.1 TaxID=2928472 RepID=UPI001FD50054|nr:ABC transporter ATP-binding protein [Acuticoccus sp. I52.16.1]UOM35386.1 ABC transporter ATP-binding protein [Acuticoccus sp. I52.16.1]
MAVAESVAQEGAPAPPGDAFVEIDNVSLAYGRGPGRTLALRRATINVARGDFVAVVGPSGCGKSSLMKLVTGLMRPTVGAVRVDGRPVDGPLKIAGMAFQNPTLLPWRNTLDNVMLPLEIVDPHRGQLRRQRKMYKERAEALLRSVGLEGFGDRSPWQLSGGMQQRASLCRALIHEPDLLMLDEPFAALDAFTREELWGVLQKLWMERKFTVILVTHDLREAVYLANTIHIMSARPGRIVATREVPFGFPRTLEDTFKPEFVEIVHDLRDHIGRERQA